MPRTGKVKSHTIKPDPVYQDLLVVKFINKIMRDGKKTIAQKHIYQTLEQLKQKTKNDPLVVLREAVNNVKPSMEVRSRRVGGAAYQVPMPVRGDRREALAIRWIIQSARNKPNSQYHHFYDKLTAELLDAHKNQGGAVEKKKQVHKTSEANKAFSHFRW